jgi:hypothetical protein
MDLFTCYRFLLGFYPNDFRRQFSDEISRMVQAIATHDFPGTRRYSEEEIRLKAFLRED